jgi:uncharacterized protein DUF4038/collagenase-like protein with putative collagen-binding domain
VVVTAQVSTSQVTRVSVTVTPAGMSADLAPGASSTFTGTFDVQAGVQQTVSATALAGTTVVATGTGTSTVAKGETAQLAITALDVTGPAPQPDHSPVITSLSASATTAFVGSQVSLAAAAIDADNDPITFAWSNAPAGCGTFASPSSSSTSWTAGAAGTCVVTMTVTARSLSDSRSVDIAVGGVFPVRYSANRRYLVEQSGNPFPILGRTAWFITSLSAADYKTFLDDTAAKGFNAIEFHVVNHDDRGNNPPYGNNGTLLPFLKRLDGTTFDGNLDPSFSAVDFTTPNEPYWQFVDGILNEALARGILCFMFPAYWGFGGGQQGWGVEINANGATRMGSYGTFIATRYKNQPNLVWMAGGDYGNSGAPFSGLETVIEKALLDGVDGVPGKLSTFWAAEWSFGQSIDQDDFGSRMTLNGIYDFGGNQATFREGWLYPPVEPAFNLESPYDEEGPDGVLRNPNATQPVRRYLWWSILGTIGGYITGNGFVWPFTTGWQDHLNTQGAQDLARLNAFYRSIAWQQLVPTNLGGSKTLIVAGGSTDSSNDWVAAAADPAGTILVAYIPPAHSGSITVDMTALSGTAQARWFNPTTALYTDIGTFPNTGTQPFNPPGDNGTGFDDWVLVIAKQ